LVGLPESGGGRHELGESRERDGELAAPGTHSSAEMSVRNFVPTSSGLDPRRAAPVREIQ
jgi:hypothetical protein